MCNIDSLRVQFAVHNISFCHDLYALAGSDSFDWQLYLRLLGGQAAPPSALAHVSFQKLFYFYFHDDNCLV